MKAFQVRRVDFVKDEDLNSASLVLAEDPDGGGARLEISKALSYDEQDKALGQDIYSLSDEAGATHYGGVVDWTFQRPTLLITLEPQASEVLKAEGGYQLTLSREEESTTLNALDELLPR